MKGLKTQSSTNYGHYPTGISKVKSQNPNIVEMVTFSNKLVSAEEKEKPFSGKQHHNFSLKTPKILALILITTSLTLKLLLQICVYFNLTALMHAPVKVDLALAK